MSKRKYTKKEKQVTLQTPAVDTTETFTVNNSVPAEVLSNLENISADTLIKPVKAQEQLEVSTSTVPFFTFHIFIENEGENNGVVTDEFINGLDSRCYQPKTPRSLINPNTDRFQNKPLCGLTESKQYYKQDEDLKKLTFSLKGSAVNKIIPVENNSQLTKVDLVDPISMTVRRDDWMEITVEQLQGICSLYDLKKVMRNSMLTCQLPGKAYVKLKRSDLNDLEHFVKVIKESDFTEYTQQESSNPGYGFSFLLDCKGQLIEDSTLRKPGSELTQEEIRNWILKRNLGGETNVEISNNVPAQDIDQVLTDSVKAEEDDDYDFARKALSSDFTEEQIEKHITELKLKNQYNEKLMDVCYELDKLINIVLERENIKYVEAGTDAGYTQIDPYTNFTYFISDKQHVHDGSGRFIYKSTWDYWFENWKINLHKNFVIYQTCLNGGSSKKDSLYKLVLTNIVDNIWRVFTRNYLITFLEKEEISFIDCIEVLKQSQEYYNKQGSETGRYKILSDSALYEMRAKQSWDFEYDNPADFYACSCNQIPCIHHEIKAECDELRQTIEDKDKELEVLRSKIEASTKMIESLLANIDNKTINTVPVNNLTWIPNFIKNLFN